MEIAIGRKYTELGDNVHVHSVLWCLDFLIRSLLCMPIINNQRLGLRINLFLHIIR